MTLDCIIPFSARYVELEGAASSRFDAYDVTRSLMAYSRILAISTSLFVNGSVIKQAPYLKNAKIFIRPSRQGSFEGIFEVAIPILVDATKAVTQIGFTEYTKYLFSRAIGKKYDSQNSVARKIISEQGGAIEAVVQNLGPRFQDIHRPIASADGASQCIVVIGSGNSIILNPQSKEFVETTIMDSTETTYVGSVSSFNVNESSGGVFIHDEGRVVSFRSKSGKFSPAQNTVLADSLSAYAKRGRKDVRVRGFAERANDNRLKTIKITSVSNL